MKEEWVSRNGPAIRDFVQPKTIPLLVFDGEVGPQRLTERLTGVLVELGGRHFVLTAGHCVKACRAAKNVVVPIVAGWEVEDAIRLGPKLEPKFLNSNSAIKGEGTEDFGYLELNPETALTMEAKVFSFTSRITVRSAPNTSQRDEWVIVAGYPRAIAHRAERSDEARFMIAFTLVARKEELPEESGAPEGFATLDLLVPENSVETEDGTVFMPTQPASFQGVSGGGCWTLDVSRDAADWTSDNKPSLCAIHTGHMEGKLLREVPIGYHLRLLADDHPDLAPELNARWPELKDFSLRR